MNSLYGQRGAICAYFHWTWEYLTKGISWAMVQRMLADQARYDTEEEDGGGSFGGSGDVELTEDNADQFINYINSLSRGE